MLAVLYKSVALRVAPVPAACQSAAMSPTPAKVGGGLSGSARHVAQE